MTEQIKMSRNLEQLAMELYEGITEPSALYQRGILIHASTDHPQMIMPQYLKRQYRNGIALIIQHMWSGLKLDEGGFMITLSFNRTPTPIYVPWESIAGWKWQEPEPPKKPSLASFLKQTDEIQL